MMVLSSALSCAFTLTGLWLSYLWNLTSGATIIMVSAAGFIAAVLWDRLRSIRAPDFIFGKGHSQ
jgi:zinc transport system permease protein